MKCLFVVLVSLFLLGQYAHGQNPPADCRQLLDKIGKKLDDKIKMVADAGKIEPRHLVQLDEWFSELNAIADNNNFGLFARRGLSSQTCSDKFEDIFRNFFKSGKQFLFQPAKCPTINECTGLYIDEERTRQRMGKINTLSFVLRAVYPLADFRTLDLTEKNTYTAFYNYLYFERTPNDPGIYAFFYTHQDDIKKATGFDPNPGTEDKKYFAQSFILTFKSHLQYYFGVAEEEFANVDAADIRTGGLTADYYRRNLKSELVKGLRLMASELENLKVICSELSTLPYKGLTSRITNYNPVIKTDKVPEKPTGEAGILKPGYGWLLLGILDANGKVYKEYGDNPHGQLHVEENGIKRYVTTITGSKYQQVPAGRYLATISIAGYPQSGITITAGGETHVALRLGRLVLDPRNFDETASEQEVNVFAILDKPATPGGARLTNTVVTYSGKGGDSLNLAPGRYVVVTRYGVVQKDTITIRSQECTKLTITGAAKFTATKEGIDIWKVIPNAVPEWITVLGNGKDIQLPPGLYQVKIRGTNKGYRLTMLSGRVYTYQMPG